MNTVPRPARIIYADHHSYFSSGFKQALRKQKECKLVANATSGPDLLQKVETLQPDIVITDVDLPELNGIEVAKIIKTKSPHIGVIALTYQNKPKTIKKALQAGMNTCLLKNTPIRDVITAVKTIAKGGTYTSAALSEYYTQLFHNNTAPAKELSDREVLIIRLICQEYTSREIADQLFLSERTIEDHRKNIQRKIQAKNMAGIVVYAVKNELVVL